MKNTLEYRGFAASIPGSGHIRYGIPCQDASAVILSPRPAVIVCDGRGSAKLSHFGAQGAVNIFRFQLAVLEPLLAKLLDEPESKPEAWTRFARILYRSMVQVKLDLAAEHKEEEKEFDFTCVLAVAGKCHLGCFQVGDGSLVVREKGIPRTVFLPEKGEFSNQTHFVRQGCEFQDHLQTALLSAEGISGIAATSDGPEHLMFQLETMTPGPVFNCFFDDLSHEELCRQDLMDFLTRQEWNNDPRGADDRSIALLVPAETNIEGKHVELENPAQSEKSEAETAAEAPKVRQKKSSSRRISKPRTPSVLLLLLLAVEAGVGSMSAAALSDEIQFFGKNFEKVEQKVRKLQEKQQKQSLNRITNGAVKGFDGD